MVVIFVLFYLGFLLVFCFLFFVFCCCCFLFLCVFFCIHSIIQLVSNYLYIFFLSFRE